MIAMNFKFPHAVQKRISTSLLVGSLVFGHSVLAADFVDPSIQETSGTVKVIVMMRDRTTLPRSLHSTSTYAQVRRALAENADASQKRLLSVLNTERSVSPEVRVKPFWLINAVVVTIPSSRISVLKNHPDVRAIYANRPMHIIRDFQGRATKLAGDPFTYGLAIMGIPQLRQENTKATGAGVTVGILDTGVDATHPDLKGKVIAFKDFVNHKPDAYDDHGHGTHVSGTIAGGNTSDTAIGIAPDAKIIMGKVFDAGGSSDNDTLLSGMQWMADPDGNPATHDQPALVSNSWGGGTPSPTTDPTDDVFCQALSSWMKLGIFPVFAAGNDGPDSGTVGSPGACPQAYAVGATNKNDGIASFSSRGPTVWKSSTLQRPGISAPGVDILSAAPGGQYVTMSGTSMATPHAAGVLALIYQAMPNITIEDASKLVSSTSKDLGPTGPDADFGAGRINALAAVKAAKAFRAAHSAQ